MPKITKEQFLKWEAMCANGFTLDLQKYVVWGEKEPTKQIRLDEENIIIATVGYYDERVDGGRWGETVRKIKLHLALWHPATTEGVMYSTGYGAYITLDDTPQPKKEYKKLAAWTEKLDDDTIMQYAEENGILNGIKTVTV